jgi:succinate dehydrogenase/fumarate reductase flavoprotein subunit
MAKMNREPILDCDVLVLGSGAGGLAAAVTAATQGLRVIVAEKEAVFGGTTAWSGGWMWIPRNPLATRAGIHERAEAPRTYLKSELGVQFDAAKVDALLERASSTATAFPTSIPRRARPTAGARSARCHSTAASWAS